MFQGMFRKRGRPPEPPLQIGRYDKPSHEESNQIPAHQLRDAPRQLPLPAVREFEQSAVMQQEQPGLNNAIVESSSSQQGQHDVDMLDSYNRRLAINPRDGRSSFENPQTPGQRVLRGLGPPPQIFPETSPGTFGFFFFRIPLGSSHGNPPNPGQRKTIGGGLGPQIFPRPPQGLSQGLLAFFFFFEIHWGSSPENPPGQRKTIGFCGGWAPPPPRFSPRPPQGLLAFFFFRNPLGEFSWEPPKPRAKENHRRRVFLRGFGPLRFSPRPPQAFSKKKPFPESIVPENPPGADQRKPVGLGGCFSGGGWFPPRSSPTLRLNAPRIWVHVVFDWGVPWLGGVQKHRFSQLVS